MSNPESSNNSKMSPPSPIDSFLDELLKNTTTCTHTHTCNPPGPDAPHKHTCYHTHTKVLPSEEDDVVPNEREVSASKPRRPPGNREAVRKYREKKKAHTAFLEEELEKLRALNQHLVRKLQGRAILEAEVFRLRALLGDLRAKIDQELGVSPFQKQCTTAVLKEADCVAQSNGGAMGSSRCENDIQCLRGHVGSSTLATNVGGNGNLAVHLEGNVQPSYVDCRGNTNDDGQSAEGCSLKTAEIRTSSVSQAE